MNTESFLIRHIGPRDEDIKKMLKVVKANSLDELIDETLPNNIKLNQSLNLEKEALALEYILEKHNTYFQENINKNILSNHYRRIARLYEKIYLINGNAKQIAKFYKKAFQINPLSIKNIFYRINMIAGYQYTRCLINSLRKIRGVPNA